MKMYLDGRELLFDFPYDQEQVNEMKRVEGARWDKVSRIWRVPITSIASAREFALKSEFDITSDILKFQAPKSITSQGDKRVSLHDEMIYMKFPAVKCR